jgi:hypothetical protein
MLGVAVKPLLAAVGVKIIHLALVFAGSARLFAASLATSRPHTGSGVFSRATLGLGRKQT